MNYQSSLKQYKIWSISRVHIFKLYSYINIKYINVSNYSKSSLSLLLKNIEHALDRSNIDEDLKSLELRGSTWLHN